MTLNGTVRTARERIPLWCFYLILFLTSGGPYLARADGFRNPPPTASGLALSGAAVASASGAEALFFNPAHMVSADQPEGVAAMTLARRKTDYGVGDRRLVSSDKDWQALPNAAFALPIRNSDVVLGLSLTTPFGQSSRWSEDSPFRYLVPYEARLEYLNLTTSIAAPFRPTWSVGAGVSWAISTLTLKQVYPWAAVTGVPLPDGRVHIEGDGMGVGAWIGTSWAPAEGHRVATVYRSPVRIGYEGDLFFEGFPDSSRLPPPLRTASPTSDFSTTLTFPAIFAIGYSVFLTEAIALEFLGEHLNWSRYGDPKFDAGRNAVLLPPRPPNEWSDVWNWAGGASWRLNTRWTARAGFTRLRSPMPDRSFSPILPDTDQNILTAGIGYRMGSHQIDVAYAHVHNKDRHISAEEQPSLHGRFSFDSDLLALSYRLAFR